MVNECIMGCKDEVPEVPTPAPEPQKSVFHFPIKRHDHLLPYWERFVNRGAAWHAKLSTVLCENHFEPDLINRSEKRTHLNWSKDPVPTIYVDEMLAKYPSLAPTPISYRAPPKKRIFQEDQMPKYAEIDPVIHSLDELQKHCPPGFTSRRTEDCLIFFRIDEKKKK